MPKIKIPAKVKCRKCNGTGKVWPNLSHEEIGAKEAAGILIEKISCDCEDGWRWDLGDLYRAVEDAGAIPGTALRPAEGKPDYVAAIQTCDSRHVARGDSHEEAMVAVINKVNLEAERGQDNG